MNEYNYILDKDAKVIHTIAALSSECEVEGIANRADVEGLNQQAVDSGEWSFCPRCTPTRPAAKPRRRKVARRKKAS